MAKTKKLALMAVLTAIALTIFMLESQIPAPVPVPGVKLGLANVITLTAMLILGRREAGAVLAVRIVMGECHNFSFLTARTRYIAAKPVKMPVITPETISAGA
mgnify:CR=1 FL=1